MARLPESAIITIKNKSHAITAEIAVGSAGAEGVIIAQGGLNGGWSLYARANRLKYVYNFYGVEKYIVEAQLLLLEGTHQVRMDFAYDGSGIGRGGLVSLLIDGELSGTGRVERTEIFIFSVNETCDVGYDAGSPVTDDYITPKGSFTGRVNWVELAVDAAAENNDHLISLVDRLRLALALH